jgi:hypothetical protein
VVTHSGKTLAFASFASNLYVLHTQIHTDDHNDFVLITTVSFSITFKNKHTEFNCKGMISMEQLKTCCFSYYQKTSRTEKIGAKEMNRRDCGKMEETVNLLSINPYKVTVFKVKFVW